MNMLNQEQINPLEQMKYKITEEFGVLLGVYKSSTANGSVGGEITKRLGGTLR